MRKVLTTQRDIEQLTVDTCDICHMPFECGEVVEDDPKSETVHPECVGHWLRSNFGREFL